VLLPLSFNLQNRKILLVGGGKAALEKFYQLKRTGCKLTLVAKKISPDMQNALAGQFNSQVEVLCRPFADEDLENKYMVFSAVDDETVAEQIFRLCRERNILINSADDKARCDFYTNALIDRGSVQVSVSTNGRFAGLSAILRRHLEKVLPDELTDDWEKIYDLRERAVALQSVSEKKSIITDIVSEVEKKYFRGQEK